jgi:hypothetical protein
MPDGGKVYGVNLGCLEDATPEELAANTIAAQFPSNKIPETVAHMAEMLGIKLERIDGWWVVTDPKGDGYEVVISLRSFPAGTTEKEMQDVLKTINLAHMLNAPARLAMSRPGLRITDPAKKPKLDQIPVTAKLEKLFKGYPPEKAN